ncbi:MAG TPA: hypothetical protein VK849_01145 [Longimicrobiales bacterium]|nr:hypothetical protein [Longimicrobiales bacterium]
MFRWLKRTILVLALLAVGYAGFRWGGFVFPPIERALAWARDRVPAAPEPPAPEPTPELADETLDRFERFRNGEGPDRLALGGTELSAVIRHALPGIVPPGIQDPTVELAGGRVQLSARVALGAFPRLPRLEEVTGLLPDTVSVRLEGTLVAHDRTHLALVVDRVEAGPVPLPRRMIADVLRGFGREAPAGTPPDALSVPLPDGVRSVFVQEDSLVLLPERQPTAE